MRAEAVLRPRDDAAPAHGRRPLRPVDDDLESSADSDVCFARLVDERDEIPGSAARLAAKAEVSSRRRTARSAPSSMSSQNRWGVENT